MSAFFGAYGVCFSLSGGKSGSTSGSEPGGAPAGATGPRPILSEISFEMEQGEVLALLGPNGAGKSTLLRILAGILAPDRGSQVRLRSQDLTTLDPASRARLITYVGAELRAEFPLTAIEAVMMGRFCHHPALSRKLSQEDQERIRAAMEECRCWGFRDRDLYTLSGGERQLVALARAIAQESKVLLLDESLSKMDLHHQTRVGKMLRRLAREGRTLIWVSHDVNLAAEFSDTALLLVRGCKSAHGPLESVLTDTHFKQAYPDAGIALGKNPFSGAPQLFFDQGRE